MPPFLVQSCILENATQIARNNIMAFWNDPNWVLMWGDKPKEYVITQAIRRSPWNLLQSPARNRHQKVVDGSTGDIVGYARWILPEYMDADSWIEAKIPRPNTKVFLSYLAVHPEHQHKGIATMLVQSGITAAKDLHLDIFVRASDAGLNMYRRAGFHMLDQIIQDDSKYGGNGKYGLHFLEIRIQ
ncbi:hypothetical protein EJ08DRAFT_690256 [Tothia fuscella]|uniref:N-acetyltransferase domain-containing protein n=1 Tax=Tothia fuscella TaxID=1048955 RepID=A0A9P4NGX6_9PEZI|nr:hypothetical protein EJ08DRAFT_690256 [Tothia fuscella]